MTKKSMTDKKTEWGIFQDLKKLGEVELIGDEFYLIDKEKCLYKKLIVINPNPKLLEVA